MELQTILSVNNIIILQTIGICCLNLFVPFIFNRNRFLKHVTLILVAFIFFINVLNLDHYYLNGGRAVLEIASFGNFTIKFYLEGMGLILLTLVSFLWLISIIYSIGYLRANYETNQHHYFFFVTLCILASSLVALSANLVTTFIFYEMLTLATAPLIVQGGSDHARRSLKKYLRLLMSTSIILFMPAIILINHYAGLNEFIPKGILEGKVSDTATIILFLMCIFGCAKAALIFVHNWLPTAMVASYPVSALLHAVAVVKVGLFVICKIIVYIFGLDYMHKIVGNFNWLILIPTITIFYSSIIALSQGTTKKLLAFSTISQLSFALLGVFTFTTKGVVATIFHLISHSFSKITLFFAAGNIYTVTKKNKISEMKSIAYSMPLTFIFFAIGSLSLIGIPPLAGFISKYYMIYTASYQDSIDYTVLLTVIISTIFTASYLFKIIYFGYMEPTEPVAKVEDKLLFSMRLSTGICAILSVGMFVITKIAMKFLIYVY
ncbi:MAG: putative monovalent cation/H+ antiporter subunit [Rickettsiaceae bacterium]|jgi:multicomponent Na+:H+ antiporter subunit D|nr:putative monovalent cation/H+ antiporter subunit [Rickettsiaceae bacterium]